MDVEINPDSPYSHNSNRSLGFMRIVVEPGLVALELIQVFWWKSYNQLITTLTFNVEGTSFLI
jgi:hypothetical protein